MTPSEKYGSEFWCFPFTATKADGRKFNCHDVGASIVPKQDKDSTLEFAWNVFRELAGWVCEEFATAPGDEEFRIIIAWSRLVRPGQGHIFKVWANLENIRLAGECQTYQEYARRFGSSFAPFPNWEKDVSVRP
jgi:hypothetical protein